METRCKTCRWYDTATSVNQDQTSGLCRRFPPFSCDSNGSWPGVRPVDWCAEWRPGRTVLGDPTPFKEGWSGDA
jgi:hypothetical protein